MEPDFTTAPPFFSSHWVVASKAQDSPLATTDAPAGNTLPRSGERIQIGARSSYCSSLVGRL